MDSPSLSMRRKQPAIISTHCDVVLRNAASRPSAVWTDRGLATGTALVRTPKRSSSSGETGPPAPLCVRLPNRVRIASQVSSAVWIVSSGTGPAVDSAERIEKRLQSVGHTEQQLQRMTGDEGGAFDVSQQQTRIALDAVDTAKERVEVVPRRRIVFQRERVPFNSLQVVFALHHEQFERLRRHGTKQGHGRGLIFPQPDTHVAFVLDENEHVLDGRLIAVGDQKDLPPEIAVLSLQRSAAAAPGPHEP